MWWSRSSRRSILRGARGPCVLFTVTVSHAPRIPTVDNGTQRDNGWVRVLWAAPPAGHGAGGEHARRVAEHAAADPGARAEAELVVELAVAPILAILTLARHVAYRYAQHPRHEEAHTSVRRPPYRENVSTCACALQQKKRCAPSTFPRACWHFTRPRHAV